MNAHATLTALVVPPQVAVPAGIAACLLLLAVRARPRPAPRSRGAHGRRSHPVHGLAVPRSADDRTSRAAIVVPLVVVAAVTMGAVPAVGLMVLLLARPTLERRRRARRRRRDIVATLPEALDLVIVSIEAGRLPLDALRVLHPVLPPVIGTAFGDVVARVDRGERFALALTTLPDHLGPEILSFVEALVHTEQAGLAFGPAVERLADDARHHRRRRAEAAARELPVRLSFPLVLCTLPSFVLVAIVPVLVGALSSVQVP